MKKKRISEIEKLYKVCGISEISSYSINNDLKGGAVNNRLNLGVLHERVKTVPTWTDSARGTGDIESFRLGMALGRNSNGNFCIR